MTVTDKNESGTIECSYDSNIEKETVTITVPSGKFGFVTIRINRTDLPGLIETLQNFYVLMKIATGR